MELIRKIKQSEVQAQEIIEKAKAEAVEQAEQDRQSRALLLEQAQQQRKKAVDAAVAAARAEGSAEVKKLKDQAENRRRELHQQVGGKIDAAASKVIEHLRG